MERKTFIKTGLIAFSGLGTVPVFGSKQFQDAYKSIDIKKIKEFVIAGHGDLDKVKSMLQEEPNLIYSRYDWGSGDFEEAIEGAGHLGNKEIANYLIKQGARVNIFVLTMLGKKKIVIPTLEEYPNLIYAKGAHGFSLLHHAKQGGKDSAEILDYLKDKGLKESSFKIK
ncbi:hypothetical protein [uncultured Croceitalea sp.]|uniref:hypothetical protein n=1 Tax=uncultured Croceitalea sp. TaxID=1798908 RepID=UPI003305B90F